MTKEEMKEYKKAYRQAHKEEGKEYARKYYAANKEKCKAAMKACYKAHKEQRKAYMKVYRQSHKEERKAYIEENKEQYNAYRNAYTKSDVNSLGQTKQSIRNKSLYILKRMHLNILGYETHHCFGYDDPYKFIYCSREIHLKIHQYLRDNNIAADSDHYEQIKHLLDETVLIYGV